MIEYLGIFLGVVMGVIAHVVKKVIQQRETDREFSLMKFLKQNPYKTFMVVFYACAGCAGLYVDGSLTIYTAVVTGFAANSLSGAGDAK